MNIEEAKKLEGIASTGDMDALHILLGHYNDRKFTLTKCAEELTELTDVCLKTANKKETSHPERQDMIDEIGDVEARVDMLKVAFSITDQEIQERKLYKANKYLSYLKDGKYTNGI